MNLAEALNYAYNFAQINKITEKTPSYTTVIGYLNMALGRTYQELWKRGCPLEQGEATVTTTAGQYLYPFSDFTGLANTSMVRILYRSGTNSSYFQLQRKNLGSLYDLGNDPAFTQTQGSPGAWYLATDPAYYGLFPIPQQGGTAAIKAMWAKDPTAATHYWGTPTNTALTTVCGVTNGSTAVTNTSAVGHVFSGDQFGVIEDDANGNAMPTRWYTVTGTPSGTGFTLTENYEGATNTAAMFVTSSVFALGRDWPDKALCIPYYAAYLIKMGYDPAKALAFKKMSGVYQNELIVALQRNRLSTGSGTP